MYALPSLCSLRVHNIVNIAAGSQDRSGSGSEGKRPLTGGQTGPFSKRKREDDKYIKDELVHSTNMLTLHLNRTTPFASTDVIVKAINEYFKSQSSQSSLFEITLSADGSVVGLPEIFGDEGDRATIRKFVYLFKKYTEIYDEGVREQALKDRDIKGRTVKANRTNADHMFRMSITNDAEIKRDSVKQSDYFDNEIRSSSRNSLNPPPATIASREGAKPRYPDPFKGELPNSCCAKRS